jgi:hypothetical protein
MPVLSVTNPNNYEILVSNADSSLVNVTTNKLGSSQKTFTGNTFSFQNAVSFKFYQQTVSGGSTSYSTVDVSSVSQTAIDRFLTYLFLCYYNNSTLIGELNNVADDLVERLQGGAISNNFATSLTNLPAASSNPTYVEFIHMGLNSWYGSTYINGGNSTAQTIAQMYGTRAGQVHVTGTDPTSGSLNTLYDNADTSCWKNFDFNANKYIVYTNLFNGAFSVNSASHWAQYLCLWPIFADLLSADYACIFTDLDSAFLKEGLGFFDRSTRVDTTYGWSGNYILSQFNEWSIPVVCPTWSLSRVAMAYAEEPINNNLPTVSADDDDIYYRWIGPNAEGNIASNFEKVSRSLLPLYWASDSSGNSNFRTNTNTAIVNEHGGTVDSFFNTSLGNIPAEGVNSHIVRAIRQGQPVASFSSAETRQIINNNLSWITKTFNLPSLRNVFTANAGALSADATHYSSANDLYPLEYRTALNNRIEASWVGRNQIASMTATQETLIEAWDFSGAVEPGFEEKTANFNGQLGFYYSVTTSIADITMTLPDISTCADGDQIVVKLRERADPYNFIISVFNNAVSTIDGSRRRILNVQGESIGLVANTQTNTWEIV